MSAGESKKRSREEANLPEHHQIYQPKRMKKSVTNMIEALSEQRPLHLKKIRKKKPDSTLHLKKTTTLDMQAMVIFMRYGSLTAKGPEIRTSGQVFMRTGVKPGTQWSIIKRWEENGFSIVSKKHRCGRKEILGPDVKAYLQNAKVLREQCHLTLAERVNLIKEKFGIQKLSTTALRRCYKKLKIRYVKPQMVYRTKEVNAREISDDQQKFAKVLAGKIMTGESLIYVDETTVHRWLFPGHVWAKKGMMFAMPERRGQSITVIGAIHPLRGLLHFKAFYGSNTQVTFAAFIEELREKAPPHSTVVMDNLSVHKANRVTSLFNSNFKQLFMTPYSSPFNPIERLWALVKRKWRHLMVKRQSEELTQEVTLNIIKDTMVSIKKPVVKKLCLSHHQALIKSLRGHLI